MNDTSTVARSTAGARREHRRPKRPRVRPLHHGHTGILAQPVVERPVAHVDGDHRGRAPLQETVGEASGGGTHVDRRATGHRQPCRVEGVRELDAAARDVRRPLVHVYEFVVVDQLAGLGGGAPAGPEVHLPCHDRGRGARARREQAAVSEQCVQAPLAHPCEPLHTAAPRGPPPAARRALAGAPANVPQITDSTPKAQYFPVKTRFRQDTQGGLKCLCRSP